MNLMKSVWCFSWLVIIYLPTTIKAEEQIFTFRNNNVLHKRQQTIPSFVRTSQIQTYSSRLVDYHVVLFGVSSCLFLFRMNWNIQRELEIDLYERWSCINVELSYFPRRGAMSFTRCYISSNFWHSIVPQLTVFYNIFNKNTYYLHYHSHY